MDRVYNGASDSFSFAPGGSEGTTCNRTRKVSGGWGWCCVGVMLRLLVLMGCATSVYGVVLPLM